MPGNKRAVSETPFDNAPTGAPPVKEKNFLLFIAIDYYQQSKLNLENPVRDANRLLQVLIRRYKFSPEDKNNYTDLRDKDVRYSDKMKYRFPINVYNDKYIHCLYNEEANPGNIQASVNEIRQHMTPNDNLLIYYAGHGYADPNTKDWYFTHYQHDILNPNGLYFRQFANGAGKKNGEINCKNMLFILDACFAGNVLSGFSNHKYENYGLMALTSTGGKELAADGKILQGSPFSSALINVLLNNRRKEIDAKDLLAELKKVFDAPDQTLHLGVIPDSEGVSCFRFPLGNPDGENASLFAETIFDNLNFLEERNIINKEVNTTLNTEYIVLSSVSGLDKYHQLIGGVCSRVLLRKVRLKEAPKNVNTVTCKDGNVWLSIARSLDIPATSEEEVAEKVLDALHDRLMADYITPDPTTESIAPYFMGLKFENLTPEKTMGIKTFCEKLLTGLHQKKQANVGNGIEYSPLFLFIFDMRSGPNQFTAGNFEISPAACQKKCSPFILFHKEEAKATIELGQAEDWFELSKEIFRSIGTTRLQAEWVTQQFLNKNNVDIIDFIIAAAQETGLQMPDITQILFKTN